MSPRAAAERFAFQVCCMGARASDLASEWPPGQMVCPRALRLAWSEYRVFTREGTGGHLAVVMKPEKVLALMLKLVLVQNRMAGVERDVPELFTGEGS